jgi:hypothetical protein
MKKLALLPVAALAMAACAEMPTAPQAPLHADGAAFLLSSHVWQSGNGSAFHGYTAPSLDAQVDGSDVLLCAGWTDSSFDGGSTDFYSFDFLLWDDAAEAWNELDSARGDEVGENACLQLLDLEDGTYLFGANGMARVGTGQETTTHHTENAEVEVTIGGAYSIEIVGGNGANGTFNRNAAQFTLAYELLFNGETVLDCDVTVDVAPSPNQHTCDADDGERTVHIPNPTPGTSAQVDVVFSLDDTVLLTFPVES